MNEEVEYLLVQIAEHLYKNIDADLVGENWIPNTEMKLLQGIKEVAHKYGSDNFKEEMSVL